MKPGVLILSILLAFALQASGKEIDIPEELFDNFDESDEALLREFEEEGLKTDHQREKVLVAKIAEDALAETNDVASLLIPAVDPCDGVHCRPGRVCVSKDATAECVCIQDCPVELDPRRRVCTNLNETWSSDCEVHRQRCLCDTKDLECKNAEFKHLHINYYGECKELSKCTEMEMSDFPRRMRDWLFNVMRDLAERDELTEHYMQMAMEAETNMTRRWSNAAVWKWCDLDGNTDRSISRHELFPIRAPLVTLEHCIAPFLESCDKNNDHRISLSEWGKCLELDEDELDERCEKIHKNVPQLMG